MISSARQLKDLTRNLAIQKRADAQVLLRTYMMERLLERISVSQRQRNFVLKGGMLVASVVGVQARSTMDMDTVVKHFSVTVDNIRRVMTEVTAIEREDGVKFEITQVSNMMESAEYSGIRVKMEALFDGMRIPLKVAFYGSQQLFGTDGHCSSGCDI